MAIWLDSVLGGLPSPIWSMQQHHHLPLTHSQYTAVLPWGGDDTLLFEANIRLFLRLTATQTAIFKGVVGEEMVNSSQVQLPTTKTVP